ncbi:hypothetical protein VTN02DRAFT_3011 [Thermoascus thermophilus]
MPAEKQETQKKGEPETIIIGISGPSSSGKTTLARLLRTVFAVHGMKTFIIHEDDFYYPDDRIPYTTTPSGKTVQDWDTVNAIDVNFLSSTLAYVRKHGALPPRLKSKEDQNEAHDSGVDGATVQRLREQVTDRLKGKKRIASTTTTDGDGQNGKLTVAFLEGFLLYAPPESENPNHILRSIHDNIHLHLFLPAPYSIVKQRREARSGYVTIGPDPTPPSKRNVSGEDTTSKDEQERQQQQQQQQEEVDLHREDDSQPQNFWVDPPGYVDDIVWPRYVQDHAWLLLSEADGKPLQREQEEKRLGTEELIQRVGEGTNVRTDAGVTVAPGKGRLSMTEVLGWAVDEVVRCLEEKED